MLFNQSYVSVLERFGWMISMASNEQIKIDLSFP